ncbi:MAG: polysaccharide deacetylase family protein [Actinomycetota bacterium]
MNGTGDDLHGIALSMDVEPWWAGDLVREGRGGGQDIVAPAVDALLGLLEGKGVRATFFVLGTVAEEDPGLVERIAAGGHEIGSHAYEHINLTETTRSAFLASEKRTVDILTSICGERPLGFRAPSCSVGPGTPWFHETLEKDLGYRYSSSVFPMRTPLYGYPGTPLGPYIPAGEPGGGHLLEFPPTVYRGPLLRMPVCGGVYLRFQPLWLVVRLLRKVLQERPAVLYIHPRDIYPLREKPPGIGLLSRLALFHGAGKTLEKIAGLLDTFDFKPVREVLSL